MKTLWIESVGVAGPGLPGWIASQAALSGAQDFVAAPRVEQAPQLLPPNERRRATPAVRLAFAAAEDAIRTAALEPDSLASVFATSEADTGVLHRLCTALAQEAPVLSPTDFHNSVHNAAAGYWSIATGSRQPSSSVSAYDASFCAGLLEAATLAQDQVPAVLLVAYDIRPPAPLHATRPIREAFACALVLSAERRASAVASIDIQSTSEAESPMANPELEHLRQGNPAARALPLLAALASQRAGVVVLRGVGEQRFRVSVAPC